MSILNLKLFGENLLEIHEKIKKKRSGKRTKKGPSTLIEKLRHAIEHSKKLEIEYTDEKGNKTVRVIKPEEIEKDKVIAYCYLRNNWRTFKIERIKRINVI